MHDENKKRLGQFFTIKNPFLLKPFVDWMRKNDIKNEVVLEPFAGSNNLIEFLRKIGFAKEYFSYDLEPKSFNVIKRDTLMDFPKGFSLCITNPPWLAKNSATRRGLFYPQTHFDDIYKLALSKCLENCEYVGALVPESYIQTNLFFDRLDTFVSISGKIFSETENPVGLALFNKKATNDVKIFKDNFFIGYLTELLLKKPKLIKDNQIVFNHPQGNLGLIAIDSTKKASIRFCDVEELKNYAVKPQGRSITKIFTPYKINIELFNDRLCKMRKETNDIFLSPFKGLRSDGQYRRRLDFGTARSIISKDFLN